MSTISLPFENQIRHMIIFDAVASETTIPTFLASGSNGEIVMAGESGAAWAAGKDLLISKKDADGRISKSDLITPKDVSYMRAVAPVAKVGRKQVFTVGASPIVGTDYFIDLKVNYGTTEENFTSFLASVRAVTGDTATTVATKLIAELSSQLNRSIFTGYQGAKGTYTVGANILDVNKYFTFAQTAGAITIQEKDFVLSDYVVALRSFDQLLWNAVGRTSIDTYATDSTVLVNVTTPGTFAKGQGYQIKELEHYLVSHVGEFGTSDITLGHNRTYEASTAKSYYTIDLKYKDQSSNNGATQEKMLILASDSMAAINSIGAALATATGIAFTPFV